MGRPTIDMTGRRFSRLVALSMADGLWKCRCDCGIVKLVAGHLLRRGQVKSCGCLRRAVSSASMLALRAAGRCGRLSHGHAVTGRESCEWKTWTSMWARCRSPRARDYGSRGIRVCERWATFAFFLADMGPRPTPRHSIERIDTNGDYCPANCRWATKTEQARNRRSSRYVICGGERQTLAEWAERSGIKYGTLRMRLDSGWSPERAIHKPVT